MLSLCSTDKYNCLGKYIYICGDKESASYHRNNIHNYSCGKYLLVSKIYIVNITTHKVIIKFKIKILIKITFPTGK